MEHISHISVRSVVLKIHSNYCIVTWRLQRFHLSATSNLRQYAVKLFFEIVTYPRNFVVGRSWMFAVEIENLHVFKLRDRRHVSVTEFMQIGPICIWTANLVTSPNADVAN